MTKRRSLFTSLGYGVLGILAAIALWQLAASLGFGGRVLPTADETFRRLSEILGTAPLWSALGTTVLVALLGFALAAVFGVILGVIVARSWIFRAATRFLIEFLKPIPPIVVLPVFVIAMGPTVNMAIGLVVLGLITAIIAQTSFGAMNTDSVALDTASSYGLGRTRTLGEVVFPMTLPFIASALRIALPGGLLISVVAGLFGGAPGLGQLLLRATQAARPPDVFAIVVVLGILGILFHLAIEAVERTVLFWHPSQRKVQL